MPIFYPDNLQHNNPTKYLADITEIRGNSYPIGILSETGSIPEDKRKIGQIIFVSSSQQYFAFYGTNTSSAQWNLPSNWRTLSTFSGSYTGSFTGSFTGDGSGLTGIVSSKWTGSNPISRLGDVEITGSFRVSGSTSITGPLGTSIFTSNADTLVITGSILLSGSMSASGMLFATASHAVTASYVNIFPYEGNAVISGSLNVTQGITGSFRGDGSGIVLNRLVSSSITASVFNNERIFNINSGSNNILTVNNNKIDLELLTIYSNPNSNSSIFIGSSSIGQLSTGIFNTIIGGSTAASQLREGVRNTGIGRAVFENLSVGSSNTAMGDEAARNLTSGSNNTLIGKASGFRIREGSWNVALGELSGFNGSIFLSGSFNTFIGGQTNYTNANISNSIAIGFGTTVTDSNQFILGRNNVNLLIGTGSSDAKLTLFGTGSISNGNILSIFNSTNNKILQINDNRNISINTTSSNNTLTIDDPTTNGRILLTGVGTQNGIFGIRRYTSGSPLIDNTIFEIGTGTWTGTDYIAARSTGIRFITTENWTTSSRGTAVLFNTNPNGSGTFVQNMILNHNGQLTLRNNVTINNTLSAKLGIHGDGATSSTTSLLIQNSNASSSLIVYDNNHVHIGPYISDLPILTSGSNASRLNIGGGLSMIGRQSGVAGSNIFMNSLVGGGLPTFTATLATIGIAQYSATNGFQPGGNRFNFFAAENWTTGSQGTWMRYFSVPTGSLDQIVPLEITPNGQINFSPSITYPTLPENSRLYVRGRTTNSSSFTAQFLNSNGTNNILIIRDDSRVSINKTNPNTTFDVSGSTLITGSLNVTQGITGSLLGTASFTFTSSFTFTASYIDGGFY